MKIVNFIVGLACITPVLTQDIFDKKILSNPFITCQDVLYNAPDLILGYYKSDEPDSILLFIKYWKRKCMNPKEADWLKTITHIRSGRYDSDQITMSQINELVSYRRINEVSYYYSCLVETRQQEINYDLEINYAIDSIVRLIAHETTSENIDEQLILNFYASKTPSFKEISNAPTSSKLKKLYEEAISRTLDEPQTHIGFITGAVQHYENISFFGSRPTMGFVIGGKTMRHNYDFIMDFRIGASKEPYSFIYNDSLITDDKWTGMYVGFEYTFDFLQSKRLDIGISPGIGYDRITALTADNDYGEDSKFLNSFNQNVGMVLKYKFLSENFIGIHFRYNWTDYKNPGGSALDGEYFNIRITFSMLSNFWRSQRLNDLEWSNN
ncbi:hypothetical protein [Ekhidna sp.]|uniref:hypothetical protein n=1 Tax=Ekhidna sp. TaxID=2608089 RepID=UPI003B5147EB